MAVAQIIGYTTTNMMEVEARPRASRYGRRITARWGSIRSLRDPRPDQVNRGNRHLLLPARLRQQADHPETDGSIRGLLSESRYNRNPPSVLL